ncbi:succinate dehydrogenase, cytochrome b556 subunit [Thiocystis minor]|uniref:succinate dehydrogenase, cytochrome b556 subunit n=1 Tax=Thiocystis minor TaxID=61597 RepID=UPI0019114B7D|nr:succinate dehydrogenase, cytochrome b556 subunit [Thiocystis minor]MBK5966948.1 succinate dehydrogenase, cytochrome b556 subunit [Thiocystis minor]
MPTTRPVFLELWRIHLPIPGFVSILHRLSGILMVLAIPVAAILFEQALSGPDGFAATAAVLDAWPVRLVLLLLLWSLLHHLLAGLRHLLMDLDIGLDRPVARRNSWIVLIAALVLPVLLLALGGLTR